VGNLKIAFFLNLGFTILEIFGGIFTNSIAILSDALHDFGDSLALGLAWYLEKVAAKERDRFYSYGYARFSVLGAFVNSIVLIVGSIFILQSAIPRLWNPEASDAKGMIVFAVIGIVVNGAAVFRLKKGSTLNERVVALHLLEDVLGWVAILIGSVVMLFWDVPILDPILSICIMVYVLVNVVRNVRKSFRIFLQGTPQHVEPKEIVEALRALEGVVDVHDLHTWTLDGQYHVATLHVVVAGTVSLEQAEAIKVRVRHRLKDLEIDHATIEIEDQNIECGLEECAESV
jgi:cobalt-zinc-cadmium efflux system protein